MRGFQSRDRLVDGRSALFGRFRYFAEIVSELKKVNWPTRSEAKRLTIMVVAVSVAMGILLGIVDEVFSIIAETFFF